jgi:hypothetical protein
MANSSRAGKPAARGASVSRSAGTVEPSHAVTARPQQRLNTNHFAFCFARDVFDQRHVHMAAGERFIQFPRRSVKHVFVKAAARLDNRAENSHQPTRERERRMLGFRDPERTQAFLSSFGLIRQHFALERHLLSASTYRHVITRQ